MISNDQDPHALQYRMATYYPFPWWHVIHVGAPNRNSAKSQKTKFCRK